MSTYHFVRVIGRMVGFSFFLSFSPYFFILILNNSNLNIGQQWLTYPTSFKISLIVIDAVWAIREYPIDQIPFLCLC